MPEDKKKLARKMRTPKEHAQRVPIFQTAAWNNRVEAKRRKVAKQRVKSQTRRAAKAK